MQKYDNLVFIGRFQPFHNGHLSVVKKALDMSDHVTIVLGSHDAARNVRNPFSSELRSKMILDSLAPNERERIRFVPQADHTYNFDRWIAGVQSGVSAAETSHGWKAGPTRTGIIGFEKDSSSFYLRAFPSWERVDVPELPKLNATGIREEFFTLHFNEFYRKYKDEVPAAVIHILSGIWDTPSWQAMRNEFLFVADYKKQWASAPYPPTFVTTDAVLVQSGHVLLVKRGAMPGEGLLALPGGFLNQGEFIEDGVIRELIEETQISVPEKVLRGSIAKRQVYDDPWRSQRGRTITHAFLIKLDDRAPLPKVKGSDDAAKALWVPFSGIKRQQMFEDHYDILEHLIGI